MSEEKKKRLVILQTSGLDTPYRLPSPFFIATAAAAMEMDATMVFTSKGCGILKKGEAEKVFLKKGSKSIAYFLNLALDAGVKFYYCQPGLDLMDMNADDLIKEVAGVIGAAAFVDIVQEADVVLTF
ncbi:MAG: DsrE/DsrF/DrsH-like family protein [Nitrospira sp.]|nr:DsrE/DsrF/DrsH-like family protein [Nitrospira sp.]